jgi:hypothetical protein
MAPLPVPELPPVSECFFLVVAYLFPWEPLSRGTGETPMLQAFFTIIIVSRKPLIPCVFPLQAGLPLSPETTVACAEGVAGDD